jgi:xanthine/uracil permease
MKDLLPFAATFAMFCTVGTTFMMIIFSLAGAANSSPAQLRTQELWTVGLTLFAVLCVIVAIVLLRKKHPGRAALLAILPTVVMGFLLCIALLK